MGRGQGGRFPNERFREEIVDLYGPVTMVVFQPRRSSWQLNEGVS